MSRLWDISPRLTSGIGVWPGDTPLSREVLADLRAGANLTLSSLHATVHLGAHVDAPGHTALDGAGIGDLALDAFVGPCQVVHVDVGRDERVVPAHLAGRAVEAPRVLVRTATFPDPYRFTTDFAALSAELVEHVADAGVVLVGIDTPSVDLFSSKDLPAHGACVRRGVVNLEGIVLDHVPEGVYELIALPLPLAGFDASPVRAVLRELP